MSQAYMGDSINPDHIRNSFRSRDHERKKVLRECKNNKLGLMYQFGVGEDAAEGDQRWCGSAQRHYGLSIFKKEC